LAVYILNIQAVMTLKAKRVEILPNK